jgi:hypothetical protein
MKHKIIIIASIFFLSCECITPPNYDRMCVVGNEYFVCGYDYTKNGDPFKKPGKHRVVITDKKEGYVQYREVGHEVLFSRPCNEFI